MPGTHNHTESAPGRRMEKGGPDDGTWSPPPLVRACIGLDAAAFIGVAVVPGEWPWLLAVVLAAHALLGVFGMIPRNRLLGPNLVRLPAFCVREGLVALTFDDGPDPEVTPGVLGLLDRYGATASFFCVGRRARTHPELVREIVRRGHSVENHTDRHPLGFAAFGLGGMRREVTRAQAVLGMLAGRPPGFFRAPAGLRSPLLDPVLARAGLRYTTWTRRGHDSLSRDPGRVLRHLTTGLQGGDILLLHDGSCGRTREGQPVVLAVLPDLLAAIQARGLRAVSLPRALSADEPPVGSELTRSGRDGSCCSGPGYPAPAADPAAFASR